MTSSKNISVIVAHPDDEVLAFGGTIARYAKEGYKITVLFATKGITSRKTNSSSNLKKIKAIEDQAKLAANILGASKIFFADFPDNKLDSVVFLDIVQYIEKFIREVKPSTILTHYIYDLNIDHQNIAKAVATATRPLPSLPRI